MVLKGISKADFAEFQQKKESDDSIYSINQRINNLEFRIERINKTLDALGERQKSDRVALEIEFKNFSDQMDVSLKAFRIEFDRFERMIQGLKNISVQLSKNQELFSKETQVCERFSLIHEIFEDFLKKIDELNKKLFASLVKSESRYDDKLEQVKQEILSQPSEALEVKKILKEQIDCLAKEVEDFKTKSFHQDSTKQLMERKIENIYQILKKIETSKEAK